MSTDHTKTNADSLLPRIFDRFFEDRSIRWMLAAGLVIVLGSSIMLAMSHWGELTPIWKYVLLLGATSGVAVLGRWSCHRLSLHRTGSSLMMLSVLLWPVTFLTFRWAIAQPAGPPAWQYTLDILNLLLLALNVVICRWSSGQVFQHFLRERQPTFEGCYVLLCLAGALTTLIPVYLLPVGALGLWSAFAIGTIKVNRHVFWMTEEHRYPRVIGFLPILLLGSQFLGLFWLDFAKGIAPHWLGLGCVLVAIPILTATDALAKVFEQRTGNLVRPLPWSILLPFGVGLLLCVLGLVVAGSGLVPPARPQALAVTAMLVAVLMGLVAKRTKMSPFVWCMLLAATTAYNLSPVFFRELARSAVQGAAQAVQESRLPFAFYGLTYLPWLALLMGLAVIAQQRGRTYIAKPTEQFIRALSLILLALAGTHPKAVFPVSVVLMFLFAAQTLLLNPQMLLATVLSFLLAAFGWDTFLRLTLESTLPHQFKIASLIVASGLLLYPGQRLERWLNHTSAMFRDPLGPIASTYLCQRTSFVVVHVLAALQLLLPVASHSFGGGWTTTGIFGLLVLHALLVRQTWAALLSMLFAYVMASKIAWAHHVPLADIATGVMTAILCQWLLGLWLCRRPEVLIPAAMLRANHWLGRLGVNAGFVFVFLPVTALETLGKSIPWALSWPISTLIVLCLFVEAFRFRSTVLSYIACLGLPLFTSAKFVALTGSLAFDWLPPLWGLQALLGIELALRMRSSALVIRDPRVNETFLNPIRDISFLVLGVLALASFQWLTLPTMLAGALATLGFTHHALRNGRRDQVAYAMLLANWQLFPLLASVIAPEAPTTVELMRHMPPMIFQVFGLLAAASVLFWCVAQARIDSRCLLALMGHRLTLRMVSLVSLMVTFEQSGAGYLPLTFVSGIVALLIVAELWIACAEQDESRAWLAEVLLVGYLLSLFRLGALSIHPGPVMLGMLIAAVAVNIAGKLVATHKRLRVLVNPLSSTATLLPGASVLLALGHHWGGTQSTWLGFNSLCLLFAAAFYYWLGIERKASTWIVLATVILNIACILLWRELSWSDPQFFAIPLGLSVIGLVNLLRKEIPVGWHNPLRYIGALCILVSPTPHIVGGSWLHIFSLMVGGVAVVLSGIGLRSRALMYTGTAFLVADMLAMVVRGSIDEPNLLWLFGLALGVGVVALAAFCENRREYLAQRLRVVAATLETWD